MSSAIWRKGIAAASGALCDDFAVLPHVERRSIHSRRTPRGFLRGDAQGNARRGFLWIGLIVVALAIAVGHLTTPSPPVQVSAPTQTPVQTAARATDDDDATTAETRRAALGITQIPHAVANSNTLKLSRVTAMPTGAICYQFHLQNSRGVTYVRTAVLDGAVLKTSGSDGFTVLWTRLCTHQSRRDITSEVENAMKLSAK